MRPAAWSVLGLGLVLLGGLAGLASGQAPKVGAPAPEIGNGSWINSGPLTIGELRGRVVLVEFWTYG